MNKFKNRTMFNKLIAVIATTVMATAGLAMVSAPANAATISSEVINFDTNSYSTFSGSIGWFGAIDNNEGGQTSKTKARVKTWNEDTYILKVGITTGSFIPGEIIVGTASSATYSLKSSSTETLTDNYEQNDEFEQEASKIIDFSESNPFGNY